MLPDREHSRLILTQLHDRSAHVYGKAPEHSPLLQIGQPTCEQPNVPAHICPAAIGVRVAPNAGVAPVMEMVSVNVNRPFVEPSPVSLVG
jgi:hypothetical protein